MNVAPRHSLDEAFLDFHLIVNSVAGDESGDFTVVVAQAPVSRWGSRLDRLAGGHELEKRLTRAGDTRLMRDGDGSLRLRWTEDAAGADVAAPERDVFVVDRQEARERRLIGVRVALFSTLFPDTSQAYQLLARSCLRANAERKYLRLKLELPPGLSNLPWELMRCPSDFPQAEEVKQTKLSIVRYLGDIYTRSRKAGADGEDKPWLLLVRADPRSRSTPVLSQSFQNEWDKVREILRRHQSQIDCETVDGPDTFGRLVDTAQHLSRGGRPLLGFHFIGHGGVDGDGGFLVGEGPTGEAQPLYGDDLHEALDQAESLRWVILNACSTAFEPIGCPLAGLATSLAVVKNVPTVIAYSRPVATAAAEGLGSEFYKLVLGRGLAIEDAVRSLQIRYQNPGGLVVLARSVAGRVQTGIELRAGRAPVVVEEPSGPPPEGAGTEPPGPGARRRPTRPPAPEDLGEMALIPAGGFRKGLTPEQIEDLIRQFRQHLPFEPNDARQVLREEPVEDVELPAFHIDLTPVTNAQFRRFVEATGYATEAERRPGAPETWRTYAHLTDHPVVFVSYNDAEVYSAWAGKRLPTADEWKKAYRGPEGRIYPWGDAFDINLCNTAESQRGWETTPVHRFPDGRSPFGCYDMVGNVEEWTTTTDPRGGKVVLGGSWCMTCQVYGLPVLHRLAKRTFYSNEQGFRCARDASAAG